VSLHAKLSFENFVSVQTVYFIKTVHFVYTGGAIFGKQSQQVKPQTTC